jgi:hypothetical protein
MRRCRSRFRGALRTTPLPHQTGLGRAGLSRTADPVSQGSCCPSMASPAGREHPWGFSPGGVSRNYRNRIKRACEKWVVLQRPLVTVGSPRALELASVANLNSAYSQIGVGPDVMRHALVSVATVLERPRGRCRKVLSAPPADHTGGRRGRRWSRGQMGIPLGLLVCQFTMRAVLHSGCAIRDVTLARGRGRPAA